VPVTTLFRRYQFARPRLLTTLAAAAGIALTLVAASWQLGRAHEKEGLAARVEVLAREPAVSLTTAEVRAADVEGRRVAARGRFEPEYAVLIDNRIRRGVAGYHVLMPLAIEGGRRHVLVNRGWVAAPSHREQLPQLRTPPGQHDVEGRVLEHFPRAYAPSGAKPEGRVWQNVEATTFAVWSGLKLESYVLEQHSPLADGLARNWPRPDAGAEKNESYALQWYSLAALSSILFVVLSIRRERKPAA